MIEKIFSKSLIKSFTEDLVKGQIANSDPELDGLIVAGISYFLKSDLIWIVNENLATEESRVKLHMWLELLNIDREVILLPFPSRDPYFNNTISNVYNEERFKFFKTGRSGEKRIVITTPLSLKIPPGSVEQCGRSIRKINRGSKLNRDKFIEKLIDMNYSHENWVESPGQFRKRGGVVEIFPAGHRNPVRIEFFGNRVESITAFHRVSRYSINEIDKITIPSCRDFGPDLKFADLLEKENTESLLELMKGGRVIISDKDSTVQVSKKYIENFRKIYEMNKENSTLKDPDSIFDGFEKNISGININRIFDGISGDEELVRSKKNIREFSTEDLKQLKEDSRNNREIYILSPVSSLRENLRNGGIWFTGVNKIIPFSFENLKLKTVFLTERNFRYRPAEDISMDDLPAERVIGELNEGDYVVHSTHGIGKFRGTSIIKIGDVEQEFIKIEYFAKETLYVPVYEANILNKYYSSKGIPQSLDRIGGKSWSRKKNLAKKSIVTFAKELLDLYAKRRSIKGFSYAGDEMLESKLAETFSFIETPDQKKAIEDVMADLEKNYPMERLICGDVSFGKTEVAIRGAFRVVLNGRQVALLCPTTILAMQHFKTFKKRLNHLPVKVEMLSRMVTKKREKDILQNVKEGKVDILIGTHSLLSGKIEFKNLGMYIIDEEQRFGVFQKEKLKRGREDVDVLSLSATPIPRTLSMSIAGLQDISVIRTPPQGRLAVKNYIGPFFKEKVISAVLNETERGGAVFIVYNSIEKIFSFKSLLEKWIPEIPVTVIHAKMSNREIEKNLMSFIEGEYSVLLSTTIIENGIDISHVNTLIIIEADNYGLTQLYQLRGRIGRSSRQAYAYFFTKNVDVTEKARMRLDGIRDHSSVGSGFSLAELDLKLRGAGSLLGNRQHGHIEALGFEYYNALLKRTIEELKGEKKEEWTGQINVSFRYSIDKKIVENMSDRVEIYRTISEVDSLDELDGYMKELESRFGSKSNGFDRLFAVGKAKFIASRFNCKGVSLSYDHIDFDFNSEDIPLIKFNDVFFEKYRPDFLGNGRISFKVMNFNLFFSDLISVLDKSIGKEII